MFILCLSYFITTVSKIKNKFINDSFYNSPFLNRLTFEKAALFLLVHTHSQFNCNLTMTKELINLILLVPEEVLVISLPICTYK